MNDLDWTPEERLECLEELRAIGLKLSRRLRTAGVPCNAPIDYQVVVTLRGWLNRLFGRTTFGTARVEGWAMGDPRVFGIGPLILGADEAIYILGSTSAMAYPLGEDQLFTLSDVKKIRGLLLALAEKHNLKVRAEPY